MQESELNKEDEISLKELIVKLKEWYKYLLSKWKTILIAGIIGGILGFTYAHFQKPIYTAETTFVLEEGDSGGGGLGAYAGIASMAGIDLGGGGGGIFQGDNILELYKSRRMIKEALLSKDTFNNQVQLLIDRYIEFNKLRESWSSIPELASISFQGDPSKFTRIKDSLITKIVSDINVNYLEVTKPDKKLSKISVKVKSTDEIFSKSFANHIVKTVNDFYIKTKTKKSAENLAILQHQSDSLRYALNKSISGVASALDANPNANLAYQILKVPSQKRQIDVQANSGAYQEIMRNLEVAKISFRKDKPLIQLIDTPVFPLKKLIISKFSNISIGFIAGIVISLIYLIFNKVYKNIMQS